WGTGAGAPRFPVGRPDDFHEADARAVRRARGIRGHVYDVAHAECLRVDPLLRELPCRCALDRPLLRGTLLVLRFDVEERMRGTKRDLDDLALDDDRLVDVV